MAVKNHQGAFPFDRSIFQKLDSLHAACEAKVGEISNAIKAQVKSGDRSQAGSTVRRLIDEGRTLNEDFSRELRRIQQAVGISEDEIRAIERARDAELQPTDHNFWHDQILRAGIGDDLDEKLDQALANLFMNIDSDWLNAQAEKPYRLDESFLNEPLHLVGGTRVNAPLNPSAPQRFAQMLLLATDHLKKHWDLDFFSAAMFVPELAMLGTSLEEISYLGPDAQNKFMALSAMPDQDVTATIYELLVGASCLRRGLDVEMVAENRAEKRPDYRVKNFGAIPGAIECKRRLGLLQYDFDEAASVAALYKSVRWSLWKRGVHCSIEASFSCPIRTVIESDFAADVMSAVQHDEGKEPKETRWGSIAVRPLPYKGLLPLTRLYSPFFLEDVFGWSPLELQWDGLLCQVQSPRVISVESFQMPVCLKWRSESQEAITKKARGIDSLWADATKQIPDGEIGFIYIAYPEGQRAAIADARTRHILRFMEKCWHRWSVQIPATMINRLYPRAIAEGRPDLIESSMGGAAKGQEFWVTKLPWLVFTR